MADPITARQVLTDEIARHDRILEDAWALIETTYSHVAALRAKRWAADRKEATP